LRSVSHDTPKKLNVIEVADREWKYYDKAKLNVLDKIQAFKFVQKVLSKF
jgi:hypothetical protein